MAAYDAARFDPAADTIRSRPRRQLWFSPPRRAHARVEDPFEVLKTRLALGDFRVARDGAAPAVAQPEPKPRWSFSGTESGNPD